MDSLDSIFLKMKNNMQKRMNNLEKYLPVVRVENAKARGFEVSGGGEAGPDLMWLFGQIKTDGCLHVHASAVLEQKTSLSKCSSILLTYRRFDP